jgi:hypothetical protein
MSRLIERIVPRPAPENHSHSPKEEATLPRTSGWIGSICLLSALLCSVKAGEAGELGKARAADQDVVIAMSSTKSARQLYSAGR